MERIGRGVWEGRASSSSTSAREFAPDRPIVQYPLEKLARHRPRQTLGRLVRSRVRRAGSARRRRVRALWPHHGVPVPRPRGFARERAGRTRARRTRLRGSRATGDWKAVTRTMPFVTGESLSRIEYARGRRGPQEPLGRKASGNTFSVTSPALRGTKRRAAGGFVAVYVLVTLSLFVAGFALAVVLGEMPPGRTRRRPRSLPWPRSSAVSASTSRQDATSMPSRCT